MSEISLRFKNYLIQHVYHIHLYKTTRFHSFIYYSIFRKRRENKKDTIDSSTTSAAALLFSFSHGTVTVYFHLILRNSPAVLK